MIKLSNRAKVMVVKCGECIEEHFSHQVKVIDVEEDYMGADVVTYICPVTKRQAKSRVYINR